MFSGIVEEMGAILEARPGRLAIAAVKTLVDAHEGDSLAVNGACLTIAGLPEGGVVFDLMPETLRRTSLEELRSGDAVNLERALAFGGRVGGHLVQGHVDGRGELVSRQPEGDALLFRIWTPPELLRYIVEKGFIAVDGVSLTVVAVEKNAFTVSLVDYTQKATTLGNLQPGASVNLEVDILAKYVERLVEARQEVPAGEAGEREKSYASG